MKEIYVFAGLQLAIAFSEQPVTYREAVSATAALTWSSNKQNESLSNSHKTFIANFAIARFHSNYFRRQRLRTGTALHI